MNDSSKNPETKRRSPGWLFPVTFAAAFAAAKLTGDSLEPHVGKLWAALATAFVVFVVVTVLTRIFRPRGE